MFRKISVLLAGLLLASLALAGCSAASANADAPALGKEFTLPIGQTAAIDAADMTVRFAAVTADSRSPTGVQTIWAGYATCWLDVTYRGTNYTVTLKEMGLTDGYTRQTLVPGFSYVISFKLMPYPDASGYPANREYYLLATITK